MEGCVDYGGAGAASDLGMWDLAVGDYVVKGGEYEIKAAQYSGDPHAGMASGSCARHHCYSATANEPQTSSFPPARIRAGL